MTRVVIWDAKYVYREQKFESRGTLCAHAFVRGLFLARGGGVEPALIARRAGYTGEAPTMPEELRIWSELTQAKRQNSGKA